jgi:hypothetical protein
MIKPSGNKLGSMPGPRKFHAVLFIMKCDSTAPVPSHRKLISKCKIIHSLLNDQGVRILFRPKYTLVQV